MRKLLTALIFLISVAAYGQDLRSVNKRIMITEVNGKLDRGVLDSVGMVGTKIGLYCFLKV